MIFIGDCHGKTWDLKQILEKRTTKDGTPFLEVPVFQLGDMGLGFQGVTLATFPNTFRFLRGNHDNPAECRKHPNYLGDWGYLHDPSIFYLGGAFSIDYKWRTPGLSWWEDEQLSYPELLKAQELYEEMRPKIVISHECPQLVGEELLKPLMVGNQVHSSYYNAKFDCVKSRTAMALQYMFAFHQPEHWIFGHYHVDKDVKMLGTKFRCCAELSTYEI